MPLEEWVESPEVRELVHNGATLQVRMGGRGACVAWQGAAAHDAAPHTPSPRALSHALPIHPPTHPRTHAPTHPLLPLLARLRLVLWWVQILGLTNYSYWMDAAPLRQCLWTDSDARDALLEIAAARLRGLTHVGLTDRLDESVASLAAALGALCLHGGGARRAGVGGTRDGAASGGGR